MAIARTNLGTVAKRQGTTFTTTAFTVPAGGVGTDRTIYALVAARASGAISATDSRGNTWTSLGGQSNGALQLQLLVCQPATALQGGDTITFTHASARAACAALAHYNSIDLATDTAFLPNTGSSTTPSDGSEPAIFGATRDSYLWIGGYCVPSYDGHANLVPDSPFETALEADTGDQTDAAEELCVYFTEEINDVETPLGISATLDNSLAWIAGTYFVAESFNGALGGAADAVSGVSAALDSTVALGASAASESNTTADLTGGAHVAEGQADAVSGVVSAGLTHLVQLGAVAAAVSAVPSANLLHFTLEAVAAAVSGATANLSATWAVSGSAAGISGARRPNSIGPPLLGATGDPLREGGFEPYEPVQVVTLDGLVEAWKLNEQSAGSVAVPRAGSHAGFDLTETNPIPHVNDGPRGRAAQLTRANLESLYVPYNAAFVGGNVHVATGLWFRLRSKPASMHLIGFYSQAGGPNRQYRLVYNQAGARLEFVVSADGSATVPVGATSFGDPPLDQWIFAVGRHDPDADKIAIFVNGAKINETNHTTGIYGGTGAGRFEIGSVFDGTGEFLDGDVAHAFLVRGRLLTDADILALWGGGVPLVYPWV